MTEHKYRRYKSDLRREFSYRCVYCDITEPELGGAQSFCVDHYKPQSKFPKLVLKYNNLLYACRDCNQHKGSYWPTFKYRILGYVILNPRITKHKPDMHLDKSEFIWKGKTAQGAWNILRLQLSSWRRIKQRKDRYNIQKIIGNLENQLKKLYEQEIAMEQEGVNFSMLEDIKHNISDQKSQIDSLKNKISGPMD